MRIEFSNIAKHHVQRGMTEITETIHLTICQKIDISSRYLPIPPALVEIKVRVRLYLIAELKGVVTAWHRGTF